MITFMPPDQMMEAYYIVLSCLPVCLFVVIFNLYYNFWSV